MAKVRFDAPIFSLTPAESRERAEKAAQNINTDPDVQYMYDAAGGGFLFAGRDTLVGTVGMRLGMAFDDAFADTPSDPLNLSKSKSEYNPVSDPATFGGDNNPEGVAEMLKTVPYSEWPFILSSNSYAQMVDRTMFIKAGLPEAQSMVSGAEALAATGIDLVALTAIGIAAEPLAIAGLGARTTLAGRAASVGLGSWRSQAMAEAAAEAAATVSRLNLTARFAALGVAEEAMYHSLRNGLDPVYDPSATSVMLQLAGSGTIAGVLGGGVFGRAFVRSHIEEAADEFRRLRTTELPGGYTITWGDRVQFNAPAAADQMLFAPGALSMVDETRRVGRDLFFDWKRRADLGVVDTNIPGTRTLPLGEVPIAGAPRPVRRPTEETTPTIVPEETIQPSRVAVNREELAARKFLEEPFTIVRVGEAGFERGLPLPNARAMAKVERGRNQWNLADSPVPLLGSSVYRETSSDSAFKLVTNAEAGFRRYTPFFVSDNPDLAISQGGKDVFIEFDASLVNGSVNREKPIAKELGMGSEFKIDRTVVGSVKSLTFKNQKTLERFKAKFSKTFDFDNVETTERGLKVSRKKDARSTKVAKIDEEPIFEKAVQPTSPAGLETPAPVRSLAEEIAEEAQRPLRPTVGKTAKPTIGIRSAIKAAAFELSLAGVELTEEVFAMLGRALVNTNGRRLQAGGFNKAFWEEVTSNISPEAAARLRPTAERAFIPGVDRTVMDAVVRDDMVTEIWNHFRAGTHMDPAGEKSLIFQVLQEIRERGGMVNRKVVEDVVDGLREISQKPPKRINAKGKEVLDANARRAAVIKIINEKIGTAKGAKLSAAARAEIKAKPMYLPASLLNKMSVKTTGAGGAGAAGAGLLGPSPAPMGGGADFSNVPQLRQWFTERMPLLSPLFNQAARAMESNNGAARLVAWLSFNARRALDKAQPQTIFESGTMLLHKTMFTFLKGYRNGYVRFAMGGGVENVPAPTNIVSVMRHAFGKRELQRQFNQRVIKQLRTGNYDDALSAVNETAQGFRQIFNSIHEVAAEAGLRGFTKGAVRNYMPRVWRFDKIRRLATTEAGKQDLISLIRTAIDQDGRRVVIDGVEQVFTDDIDEAATAFANRLIDIARGSENAPLTQQDQELFDSLSELLGPIKAKTASKTPFGRGRLLLNEEASVALRNNPFNDNTNTLSLADLTNDDLPFVFRKYITSVMGAVNEKRLLDAFNAEMKARGVFGPRFVTSKGEVLQNEVEVDTVDKMLALVNKLGDTMEKGTMEGLREVIGAIRYEPIHQGSQGIFDKTLGIAMPFGYLTTGGQFGLAALGELSRIVGTLGLRNTIQQMPILVEMLKNWKNLDLPAQNFASFIDSWLAPSTDRMRRALFDPTVDAVRSAEIGGGGAIYNGVKRVLDSTANVMSDISGLAPITSFTQQLTAATSVQHLYDVAKGVAKRLDPATVRTLGLEPAQYEEAIRFVGANAKVENRFLGSRVVDMANIDQKEMDLVKTFVNRMVRTRIQDMPTRGDFHKHAFSFLGRLLTQFRTFNLKGVDNFLVQNAGRLGRGGGVKVVQEISATLLFAGLIQYGRNYADLKSYEAANNKKKVEELEKTLTIPGFIRGAMTGPAEFSFLTIGADALWTSTVSPDPLFSPYRYSGLNWYGFPGEAIYNRTKAVIGDVYGATVGQAMETGLEGEITESTVHKARLLLPFQNIIGVKQFLNVAEEEIDVLFNLNRNQPRKSRN